jgi:hypothetical protein
MFISLNDLNIKRIAVVGVQTSGKTQLTQALTLHFSHSQPTPFVVFEDAPQEINARYCMALVMGLDIPLGMPPETPQNAPLRVAASEALRCELSTQKIPYIVIYGQGPDRLSSAITAISTLFNDPHPQTREVAGHWQWSCDNCSDPACERRMFTDLLVTP